MTYKIGTHDLYLTDVNFNYGDINIVEKQVIPDPSTWNGTSNSILLGLGKKFDTISCKGYADKPIMQYLENAKNNYIKETFIYDNDTLTGCISKLNYEKKLGSPYYYYSFEFIVL
jgi:hypothetical protein